MSRLALAAVAGAPLNVSWRQLPVAACPIEPLVQLLLTVSGSIASTEAKLSWKPFWGTTITVDCWSAAELTELDIAAAVAMPATPQPPCQTPPHRPQAREGLPQPPHRLRSSPHSVGIRQR